MFIFTLLCGASQGFMKALKAFIKPLEPSQRSVKIKIYVVFFSSGVATLRVKEGRKNMKGRTCSCFHNHISLIKKKLGHYTFHIIKLSRRILGNITLEITTKIRPILNPLRTNPIKWSNTMCLTILWGWNVKS